MAAPRRTTNLFDHHGFRSRGRSFAGFIHRRDPEGIGTGLETGDDFEGGVFSVLQGEDVAAREHDLASAWLDGDGVGSDGARVLLSFVSDARILEVNADFAVVARMC